MLLFLLLSIRFEIKTYSPRIYPDNTVTIPIQLTLFEKMIITFKIWFNCITCNKEYINYQNEIQEFEEDIEN